MSRSFRVALNAKLAPVEKKKTHTNTWKSKREKTKNTVARIGKNNASNEEKKKRKKNIEITTTTTPNAVQIQ